MNNDPVPSVFFKMEAPGLDFYITKKGVTYVFKQRKKEQLPLSEWTEDDQLKLEITGKEPSKKYTDWDKVQLLLVDANIEKENIITNQPSKQGHLNYFYAHCPEGIYGVKEYGEITIKNVYPNIDIVFYNSNERGYKYDFILHSGADPDQIKLNYRSKSKINIDGKGCLSLKLPTGGLLENAPISYLDNQFVASSFKLEAIYADQYSIYNNIIRFEIEDKAKQTVRDQSSTLRIDPELEWSTFYGGNNADGIKSIKTDNTDNAIIAGYTYSLDFPTENAFQGTHAGGTLDIMFAKFTNDGQRVFATYYGGSANDDCNYVTTDQNDNIFLTGYTYSNDFPVQNAFQNAFAGGTRDAIVMKFDPSGVREWASYWGGSNNELANSIQVDANNNIIAVGNTNSNNLSVHNAAQPSMAGFSDGMIVKLDTDGNVIWLSYYGGNGSDNIFSLISDVNSNLYLTGNAGSTNLSIGTVAQISNAGGGDAFVTKMDPDGNVIWSSYYGGTGAEFPYSIELNSQSQIYVVGQTLSDDLPLQDPIQNTRLGNTDAFLFSIDSSGSSFLWSTYFGGTDRENTNQRYDQLTIDSRDNIYFCFHTESTDITTSDYCGSGYFKGFMEGTADDFYLKLNKFHTILEATYFGGDGFDFGPVIDIDNNDNIWMSGEWTSISNSMGYPLSDPGGTAYFDDSFNGIDDAFIMKIIPFQATQIDAEVNIGIAPSHCDSTCQAYAIVNVIAPDSQFLFFWSNGQEGDSATDLCIGNYSVVITDSACIDTAIDIEITQDVIKNQVPIEAEIYSEFGNSECDSICQAYAIVNVIAPDSQFYYLWNDGQTNATAIGLCEGSYSVTVTDSSCIDTTLFIEVNENRIVCFEVFIPNAISLNGDGYNDNISLRTSGAREIEFSIYDRFGKQVFYDNDLSEINWDGTYQGKLVSQETYYYHLKAITESHEEIEQAGLIQILR